MIYINYSLTTQEIVVPLAKAPVSGQPYHLNIKGQINLEFNDDTATAVVSPGNHFVKLTIPSVEGLEFGSYEYILYQGNASYSEDFSEDFGSADAIVLGTGVAVVGNFNNDNTQYDQDITYKQYEA